ncbi:MAG: FAD-dependent oxidoreductase [Oscillospiraceae bacterium]
MSYDSLFSPIKIRGLELKNRVVLPAMMTKMTENDTEGLVSQNLVDYHAAIARGGCGMNITEVCAIHPSTHGYAYIALYEDKHESGIKKIIDAVHAEGGKLCVQLWHGGMTAVAMLALLPDDVKAKRKPALTESLTKDEIKEIIDAYGKAAARAVSLGCDALEYHMAHTYLGHTFLSAAFNTRTDEYNGDLAARAKFPLEVIDSIRANMPKDMPLLMRIDAQDDFVKNGLTIEDIAQTLLWAREHGVDVADISRGNGKTLALKYEVPTIDTPNGYNLENVAKIKSILGDMPVIGVGRINKAELANKAIEDGACDIVAIGRAQIVDHNFCNKSKAGQDDRIRRCLACNKGCFDAVMDKRMPHMLCARNPFVGELDRPVKKVSGKDVKKVLIAGGGIGGLTAAQLLKIRGHNPIICEAGGRFGGQMLLASANAYKHEWRESIEWEIKEANRLGIDMRTNTPVTAELISVVKPDEVIVAIGARPKKLNVPMADGAKVYTYADILSDKVTPQGNVVVIGGKLCGLEATQYLLEKGVSPVVIETAKAIASDAGWIRSFNMMLNIPTAGVKCITNAVVKKITATDVVYDITDAEGKTTEASVPYDAVVLGEGAESMPSDEIQNKCKELGIPCHVIGDAKNVESILWATNAAANVALDVI